MCLRKPCKNNGVCVQLKYGGYRGFFFLNNIIFKNPFINISFSGVSAQELDSMVEHVNWVKKQLFSEGPLLKIEI